MIHVTPSPLLRRALLADAVVSGGVAALQLLATDALASLLGLPASLLTATGLFLVAYTGLLAWLASRRRMPAWLVATIVIGNLGWAAGGVALLASGSTAATALGAGFVVLQVVAVLAFGALEYLGLRRSTPVAASRDLGYA
jgi:hypothetical protein